MPELSDVIDPITPAIDAVEDLLGHSPHPAIVTVPIGAWTVSNICDGLALATGSEKYDDAARLSMAVGLVGAAAAMVTGLRDYSHIPPDRESHKVATVHGLGNAVVGSLMVASYVMRARAHERGESPSTLARVLGLAAGGFSLYTAWLGGKLVEEYGEGVQPVMDQLAMEEDFDRADEYRIPDSDAEEPHGRERLSPEAPLGPH